jgi:cytochrome c peroxidase
MRMWICMGGALLAACSGASATSTDTATDGGTNVGAQRPADHDAVAPVPSDDAASPDLPPELSAEERQLLAALAPPQLPGPAADVSNAFADNRLAAALGEKLFEEARFSGKLLDLDDDGGPNTLGPRGESGRVSCAGCHVPSAGFSDNRSTFGEISLGAGWTHRRSPSLLDVGQATIVMWGGRFSTLWSQPFGPLENPLEMNSSRLFAAELIASSYKVEYESVFGAGALDPLSDSKRFPPLSADRSGCALTNPVDHPRATPPSPTYACHGIPGDSAEYDGMASDDQKLVTRIVVNMGKSIAAYERQLACGAGRFDAWVNGDAKALTGSEQRGAKLFVGKAGCVGCHSGPFLSDQKFHNVGLAIVATREGIINDSDRGAAADLAAARSDPLGVSGSYSDGDDARLPAVLGPELEGAFRTPTLRCVTKRPSFMHTGTVHSLEEVVSFFARGGDQSGFQGTSVLTPVELSPQDVVDLVAFLRAL